MILPQVDIQEEIEKIEFVKKAAEHFSKNKDCISFTQGRIAPNCLFAMRFGLLNDSILVFKLNDDLPMIYKQCINTNVTEEVR